MILDEPAHEVPDFARGRCVQFLTKCDKRITLRTVYADNKLARFLAGFVRIFLWHRPLAIALEIGTVNVYTLYI